MHAPKSWEDRLEIENGQIVRILTAEWWHKNKPEDVFSCEVYKESDSGKAWDQNLYQSMYGGYCVAFPGLPYNTNSYWYYNPDIAEIEGWRERGRKSGVGCSRCVSDSDIDFVCQLYPDFKYVAAKYELQSLAELMDKLEMWIDHRELEILLASGFEKIGMNKNFWRMAEKNRKATCLFMRNNPQCLGLNLKEIRQAMSSENPSLCLEYFHYVPAWYRPDKKHPYYVGFSYEDFKYVKKARKKFVSTYEKEEEAVKQLVELYRDYLNMLRRSGHEFNDEYWHYPSDLNEFHNRLVEEERIREEARRMADAREHEERLKAQKKAFRQIVKKFEKINGSVDGYSIFITSDYAEWERQAEALHQCICACGYYQGTADGDYTIVFIQKEGVPVATAQIMPNGALGQFYADEINRADCAPSDEVRAALDKWMAQVPKSKFRKSKPRQRKSANKEVAA